MQPYIDVPIDDLVAEKQGGEVQVIVQVRNDRGTNIPLRGLRIGRAEFCQLRLVLCFQKCFHFEYDPDFFFTLPTRRSRGMPIRSRGTTPRRWVGSAGSRPRKPIWHKYPRMGRRGHRSNTGCGTVAPSD